MIRRFLTYGIMSLSLAILSLCSRSPVTMDNGGTDFPNTKAVVGSLFSSDGAASPRTLVRLAPRAFNPAVDIQSAPFPVDTTDFEGTYRFSLVDTGEYTITAVQLDKRTRAIICGVHVVNDTVRIAPDTLRWPGTITVTLPASVDAINGYFFVPGTTIDASLNSNDGFVTLDSVPAGVIPSVNYGAAGSSTMRVIRYDIPVSPGSATEVLYPEWDHAKRIILNTTASGADMKGNVTCFPALIRLTHDNFDFSQAQRGGGDIRFTKTDNTPIPYEIEGWDPVTEHAEVWVRIDTVYGNNGTQFIVMYWGASASSATAVSNGSAVFDTAASKGGFQGVWHMGQAGNTLAKDATINGYDGTPFNMTAASAVPGMIGAAQEFDGASSYIQMSNSSSGKLNFPENGFYSVSAWVNCNTSDFTQFVAGKGHEQYYLKFNLSIGWEFVEWKDNSGPQITSSSLPEIKTWKYLVGVRNGTSQKLYVDGTCIDSTIYDFPDTVPRNSQSDFSIGAYLAYVLTTEVNEGYCFFNGKIDEVRVSNIILSADWIKLCYMNQKTPDALITW